MNAITDISFADIDLVNGGTAATARLVLRRVSPYYAIYEMAKEAGEFAEKVGYWLGSGEWPS
jgi:hypothetical protein